MAAYGEVNLNYWFYEHQAHTGVAGLGNLSGVREMRYTFNSCKALVSLDLSGMDSSSLEDLTYTFSGCDALATIWADAGWARRRIALGTSLPCGRREGRGVA